MQQTGIFCRPHRGALPRPLGVDPRRGKVWHGGLDLAGLDDATIECPTIKASASRARVTRALSSRTGATRPGVGLLCLCSAGPRADARRRELFVFCPLCVASGQGRAARGERGRAGRHGQYRQCGALADPPYRHCHLEVRTAAGGVGLDPTVYRRGARTLSACTARRDGCRSSRWGRSPKGDADAVLKSAGPAGWWMPDCTEANGGMLNGETKSVCQRQGRCGGGVRGVYGGLRLAGVACCGVGRLHGAGLAQRQCRCGQPGAVVQRSGAGGHLAQGRDGGRCAVCALTDAVLAVAVANLPGLGLEVNGVVLPVVLGGTFLPSSVPLPRTPPPWAHPCPGGW